MRQFPHANPGKDRHHAAAARALAVLPRRPGHHQPALYAENDADEARVWTPDGFRVVALTLTPHGWRIDTSDGPLPEDAHEQVFTRVAHALAYIAEVHGTSYAPEVPDQ